MISAKLTDLNKNEILMYLGYRGQEIDSRLEDQIGRCMEEVRKYSVPRLVYALFPLEKQKITSEEEIFKAGDLILEGRDIKELLKECSEAVLLGVTLGARISSLISKMEVKDMGSALIMDSCASAAVENVCDNFEEELKSQLKEKGLFLTQRYSPGYGDLPLSLQRDFCRILDTSRRIGLTVTENFLMVPQKSVTAIMGIASKPQPERKKGCEGCSMFLSCPYRKDKKSCS